MANRVWVLITALAAAIAVTAACTAPRERRDGSSAQPPLPERRVAPKLDHLSPPRDMTGAAPTYFEWTAVEGADHYAIGIWNDVDVLVWRRDDISTTSIDWPADLKPEFGTYFWSVTALRDDIPIVDSGRSAFVILR